ncbi:hypothetical protein GGS20DRAFT_528484 [Poronia punctata]|nr:hypothetical protein GGS20DRAFT_528484 [Poronia punctata]
MRLISFLATALPLVAASPVSGGHVGGYEITDPAVLAELRAQHADALHKYNTGETVYVTPDELEDHQLDGSVHRRIFVTGLAGVVVIEAIGAILDITLGTIASNILRVFRRDDFATWENTKLCRAEFYTHAGADLKADTYGRGVRNDLSPPYSKDAPSVSTSYHLAWNNPENTDPPVKFMYDEWLGNYSIMYTATDRVAWSGIEGTKKCFFQGICYPQYIFYHTGYNIIFNTWQSEGDRTACQYTHGECQGLCQTFIYDQFSTNGNKWGGGCAVPCWDDGGNGLPTVPTEPDEPDVPADPPVDHLHYTFMIAGDSISHGMDDDWTWRYRLLEFLNTQNHIVEFVGPFEGTHAFATPSESVPQPPRFPGEPEPVDPMTSVGRFASGVSSRLRHASWWGRQAKQTKDTIHDWVDRHRPDFLLLLLGFNDLGWFINGPDGLIGDIGQIVQHAREAKRDIKILIGNVVDREFIGGREDLVLNTAIYNKGLEARMTNWFRYESPLSYVDVNSNYDCRASGCPDGYDGLHPNAKGEYHIAQAFARVLKRDFAFVGPDFVVPSNIPGRPVGAPGNVVSRSHPEGIVTTWDRVTNARGYEIRSKIDGMSGWWSEGAVYPNTWASWSNWILDDQTWQFQVRTVGDGNTRSAWSGLTSVTAHPKTAPGPKNIRVLPGGGGSVQFSWSPVSGYAVERYAVIVWDLDTEGAFIDMRAVSGTSATIGGLEPGHRYGTWVATYVSLTSGFTGKNMVAGGLPAAGREVIVGQGAPAAAPSRLDVVNIDPTTVRLSWNAVANAGGYAIYHRSVRDNTALEIWGTTTSTSQEVIWLYPGTWNFEFCIAAYNGDLETSHNACVIPPVYPGFRKRDEVQAPEGSNTSTTYDTQSMMKDVKLQKLYSQLMSQNGTALAF